MSLYEKIKQIEAGRLSDQSKPTVFVPTGSFALNKVISGRFDGGIPVGGITQFRGESSTAKTVFLTSILVEAQKLGYYTILDDAENAFSPDFAEKLGINPDLLFYNNSETVEEAFEYVKKTVAAIRAEDRDTPIVAGIDSLAVLPTKKEMDEKYEETPMDGAYRAKVTGGELRRINGMLRKHNVALVVINQVREKVGVMFGNPETNAAGGKALDYYLHVDLKTISNKTSDVLGEKNDKPVGIKGRLDCKKNKCSVPFRSCKFELLFDKGLTPTCDLLPFLAEDGIVEVAPNGRCNYNGFKFTTKEFDGLIMDKLVAELEPIREMLGM